MLTTTDIKNLSIALEALSRIPKVEDLSLRIQSLLDDAITKTEDRERERRTKTPMRELYPAPPAPYDPDEIPF